MSTAAKERLTPAEYLARERKAEFRSEYFAGEMFAMAGTTRQHARIMTNLVSRADQQLRDTPCDVFGTDVRVKVAPTGLYSYPDVIIACGDVQYEDEVLDTLLNPRVIFEVLSPSTEAYDRGKKFDHYRQIPSLTEYVLVSQSEPLVERFSRQSKGTWQLTVLKGLETALQLESVPCRLPLAEIYFKVPFTESEAGNGSSAAVT